MTDLLSASSSSDQTFVSPSTPAGGLPAAGPSVPAGQQQHQQHQQHPPGFNVTSLQPGITNANGSAHDAFNVQARLALAQQAMQGLQPGQAGMQGVQFPNGLAGGMNGSSQEQLFSQLQALQASQRLRMSGQSGMSPSQSLNGFPNAPAPEGSQPDPSAFNGGSTASNANLPNQLTQQQREAFFAQQRLLQQQMATGTPAANASTPQNSTNSPAPNQPNPPRQPNSAQAQVIASQRRQFLTSLINWYKSQNIPLPTDVFNGERDGAVKVAGVWVDLIDLFMVIMRAQGIANAVKQPPESPLWQGLLTSRGIPNPLPQPVNIPRHPNANPNTPVQTTTNAIQYLIAVYLAYVKGFEDHMQKQRQASIQRQATKASPAPGSVPDAAQAAATHSVLPQAPTPSAPTPSAPTPTAQPPPAADGASSSPLPTQAASTPSAPSPWTGNSDAAGPSRPTPLDVSQTKPVPSPIDTALASAGVQPAINTPETPPSEKKRILIDGETEDSAEAATAAEDGPTKSPKRKRYKVEYRPIHLPYPAAAGWDERAVRSTFPKNNLQQPTHSIHELGVIDMEAILMGLRSRLPHELGYCITALSMLSMPHPEDNLDGLPLLHLLEIYNELIELVEEATFGDEGYEAWMKRHEGQSTDSLEYDLSKVDFLELEQIGRHTDVSMTESVTGDERWRKERTGGSTEIVLSVLNLLRNFSMFEDNRQVMGRVPQLFVVLSRVIDSRLARVPGRSTDEPFSLHEYARVRRDATVILTNVGQFFKLSVVPFDSVLSVFNMLSKTLASGFEVIHARDPGYGPGPGSRQVTVPIVHSIYRAAEAFYSIALTDSNREVLSKIPTDELVDMFDSLVKLLPVTARADEALTSVETHLIYVECLALALYSLAFLAPLSARTAMRKVPGAVTVLKRCITNTMRRNPSFRANPHNVLCRRLAEVLGVLNGTVSCAGEISAGRMSFSAGSGEGKGWRWSAGIVQPAWFADDYERIAECLTVPGVDAHTFGELDAMWWGAGAE